MKTFINRFTLQPLAFSLLCLAAHTVQAVTESNQNHYTNPAATATIKAAPSAEQSHMLKVQLDPKGEWSVVPSSTVKMRFQYTHQWSLQPNAGAWARIYVGEAHGGKYAQAQMFDLSNAKVLAASGQQNANLPFSMLVADGIPGADIALYCAFEKDNRLKQGKTLNQVLRQGFNVKLNVPLSLVGWYELGGGPNTSRPASNHQYVVETTAPVTIQCLGNPAIADKVAPPMGPEGLAAPFHVNSVELVAFSYQRSTVCPAEITLKATVKGVGGGDFKYWLEELGGQAAAVQLTSNLPGKVGEQSIRVLQQKVSLKPGSPVVNQQGVGGIKANTPGGTVVKRSFRFNVLAPNKVQSDKLDIEVLCTSTLNVQPGGQNGGLMAPANPQPPVPGLKIQAVDPVPPKPSQQIQAPRPQPEPPKPSLQIKAVEPQPPQPQRLSQ